MEAKNKRQLKIVQDSSNVHNSQDALNQLLRREPAILQDSSRQNSRYTFVDSNHVALESQKYSFDNHATLKLKRPDASVFDLIKNSFTNDNDLTQIKGRVISRNDLMQITKSSDKQTEAIRFIAQFVMPKQQKHDLKR